MVFEVQEEEEDHLGWDGKICPLTVGEEE